MTAEKNPTPTRRARTEAAREGRRAAILEAASAYLEEVGFDAVSMNGLAQRAGLAKGTLYLYFKTREEVMVALYLDRLAGFRTKVLAGLASGMDVAEVFIEAGEQDPTFLALTARLSSVIEQNLPLDVLIETKRATMREFAFVAEALGQRLGLTGEARMRVSLGLSTVFQGAASSSAIAPPEGAPLPDDVEQIFQQMSFRSLVQAGFDGILSGVSAHS